MFNKIKGYFQRHKKINNLEKAQRHALIALAYWKKCDEDSDLHFQIINSVFYVRLGKTDTKS